VLIVGAGLLGGSLGAVTTVSKLKLRTAIDASPEPVSNAVATGAELSTVAGMAWLVWSHPWLALVVAAFLLVLLFLVTRAIWGALRRAATWMRGS
jgi:prephenate dehydrogenase